MKKLILIAILLFTASASAQAPTKLFDVRNGNGIVDGGVVQAQAVYIAFQDNAAKQKVIDALCDVGNYDALDPATRPSKQAFALRELQNHLKDVIRESRQRTAQKSVPAVDVSDLP